MFIATVGIQAVKNHLNRVIDYTPDNNKTTGEFYDELHNVIDYVGSNYKIEQKLYVTGINCSSETAYQEMINIKKFYHKEDDILAFHAFHSYKKGEVTPELAHEVGLQNSKQRFRYSNSSSQVI